MNYGEPLEQVSVDSGRLRKVIERVTDMSGGRIANDPRDRARRARSFVSYTAVVIIGRARNGSQSGSTKRDRDRWTARYQSERVHSRWKVRVVMASGQRTVRRRDEDTCARRQTKLPRRARFARTATCHAAFTPRSLRRTGRRGGVGEPGVPRSERDSRTRSFALTKQASAEIPSRARGPNPPPRSITRASDGLDAPAEQLTRRTRSLRSRDYDQRRPVADRRIVQRGWKASDVDLRSERQSR